MSEKHLMLCLNSYCQSMCATCWASYVIFFVCVRLCYVLSQCLKDLCPFWGIFTNNTWDLSFSLILWAPKNYERFLWSFKTQLTAINPHLDVRIFWNSSMKRVGWMKTVRIPLSDCTNSAGGSKIGVQFCTNSAANPRREYVLIFAVIYTSTSDS